jgi:ornithine cyclodeaminase/alanine dehydrogenase-like protein (mu-crystallin family)
MSNLVIPMLIDLPRTRASLSFNRLIPELRTAFIAGAEVPLRHRHVLEAPGAAPATLLLMPAWKQGAFVGVKIVTVFTGNGALGLNAVSSTYLLCDGATGRHLALFDGNEITSRRTAGASALAASFLARQDAASLLIVGAGHVSSILAAAFRTVRPIRKVRVWNIRRGKAERLAAELLEQDLDAACADDLETAVREADIVSCATLASEPLVHGAWLRRGTHLDLIGGYRPDMREADDEAVRRSRVYIDTAAALTESGDLTQPIARGVLAPNQIVGTLETLCRGQVCARRSTDEITLFKSVGSGIEDLAAAVLVYRNAVE